MGLKRVFGAVTPLIAIIITLGLDLSIQRLTYKKVRTLIPILLIASSIALLFSAGPSGIKWDKELNLSPPQKMAQQVTNYLEKEEISYQRILYADRYLAEGLPIDPYNASEFHILDSDGLANLKYDDLLIWDNWHAPTDFNIELSQLEIRNDLVRLKDFTNEEHSRKVHYVLWKVK